MAGAGYGIPDGSGGYVTKLEGDGDAKIGDSSGDLIQITGSVEQLGTSLKISGDDARIKINGDTDSHPGLEFLENGSRHWIVYNDYTTDNLTFKSSADRVVITDAGRLGIGTTSPDYKLDVAGNISLNEHIYHNGDANTRFSFPGNDEINIVAGGNSVFKFASNTITLNNGNQNYDTKVMADNGQVVLHVDAGDNRVGVGTTSPSVDLDVAGDVNFDGSAVFNESGAQAKDFRVESYNNTHMFFIDAGTNRIGIGNNSPQAVLDITDPFEGTGAEKDAVIRLRSRRDVGIKLIADTANTSGEADNPFIDFYQDGQADSSARAGRLASIAMEGNAATTFTGSLANALFIDAYCPQHDNSNIRTIQFANDSSNNGHSARITIEGTNGYVGIWTSTPSHALEVAGQFKATEEVIFGTTSTNLGSGDTSTLTPESSVHLLTATSITASAMGFHTMTLADGTTAGQILKIIMVTTTNNQPIMISTTNVLGGSSFSAIAIENNKQGAAIEFIWTGSAWAVIGNNSLASVQ